MKLELKNVKLSLSQSQETTAFTGTLYINDIKAAACSNSGHGGANCINAFLGQVSLVAQAEQYCKSLPPDVSEYGEIQMDLEFWVSIEVGNFETNRLIANKSKKHIVVGNPKNMESLRFFTLPQHLLERSGKGDMDAILRMPTGPTSLRKYIDQVKVRLLPGEQILNKNIPIELL